MSVPPRSLGISVPEGRDVHEIYVKVLSRPSILGKISDLMGKRNIDIIGAHIQVSEDKTTGHILLYVEMADSTAKIEEVIYALRSQDYVKDVITYPRQEIFFEEIMFPLTSGGHYRVFVLGASVWAAIVKSLREMFGQTAGFVLRNEGTFAGRAAVSRIEGRFTSQGLKIPEKRVLLENVIAYYKASGLGILEVKGEPSGFKVSITEGVLSGSSAEGVDDFLVGMVKGALEQIYGTNYLVQNLSFKEGRLSFELLPV